MNRAFEVSLNGERLCVAGISGDGVLTAIVQDTADESTLIVAGLSSASGEHVTWTETPLKAGDDVQVRIRESNGVDEPRTRTRPHAGRELERQRAYVRAMAKKLGWTLVE